MSALDDAEFMNSSEMPTFLNEMAMRFPKESKERIGLLECSIYISVVRNVLERSKQKEPVVGIKQEKNEKIPCILFSRICKGTPVQNTIHFD